MAGNSRHPDPINAVPRTVLALVIAAALLMSAPAFGV
jgi:hypothetical protein